MAEGQNIARIKLFNIAIDNVDMEGAVARIDQLVLNKQNSYVVTPNVDHIVKLQHDLDFRQIYDHASLVVADGMPLVWVSALFKTPLKERVTGADLFPRVCRLAAEKGYSVFLLGADKGVASEAAANLAQTFSGLNVCGTYSPTYGFENSENENLHILSLLEAAKPDILFVGVGAPKQEKWIYKYRQRYRVPVAIGVGASFDFVAGSIQRAPQWMQKAGLEWFYRFLMEPRRLFRRYFIDGCEFFWMTLREWRRMESQRNRS